MVTVQAWLAVQLRASRAVTVNVNVPFTTGVPANTPLEFNVNPAGTGPLANT
jgi:hypothetical protein